METNDLKLYAECYIDLSEITKENKQQLLNFVKEASDEQIWYLLLNGKIVTEKYLQELSGPWQHIAKALSKIPFPGDLWFKRSAFNKGMAAVKGSSIDKAVTIAGKHYALLKGGAILSATAVAAIVLWMAIRAARGDFTKFKQCLKLPKETKRLCRDKIQRQIWQKELKVMVSQKKLCDKAKDPEKCKQKVDKKISQIRSSLSSKDR